MRLALPLFALVFTAGAAAQDSGSPPAASPQPEIAFSGAESDRAELCRDRIHLARQERGLPDLRRESAKEDEALMIKAVDYRLDGCGVMVAHAGNSDIRPVPQPEGPPRLRRIR